MRLKARRLVAVVGPMRVVTCLVALAFASCSGGDEPAFNNVCRVDEEFGYSELSWDEDATSRFLELTRSVAGGDPVVAQCTQLDTSLPPACSVDVETYCPTPEPNDGNAGEPCTSNWVFVVKGGHLIVEFDSGGFSEVGKCGAKS